MCVCVFKAEMGGGWPESCLRKYGEASFLAAAYCVGFLWVVKS